MFFDYNRQHDVDIRVARIFNTYGPRMSPNDGRVISNFIVQALQGNDITIYGDGAQTRSFCFVEDLIEGIVTFMDSDNTGPGPVNLGNPVEFTMLEVAELVLELVGGPSRIIHMPLPSDDPTRRRPDISHARKTLDWETQTPLKEGLEHTITYFRDML